MKFLIVHNRYKTRGGEESVVATQGSLLSSAGHSVVVYERAYAEIATRRFGRVRSFFSAFYGRRAIRELRSLVDREKPDVALIHNLYPLISPAILPILKRRGVRTVMMLHNFRLVCPIGLFFHDGKVCERCGESRGRELECIKHRCEGSAAGSVAFALRSMWGRKMRYFDSVDYFCALSSFQADKLVAYGVESCKMRVLCNPLDDLPKSDVERQKFVGIAGRFSPEKGALLFLDAARAMPDVRFKVAGDIYLDIADAPDNVEFVGRLDGGALADFYSSACVVVSCSVWYETFGLSIAEAMYYGAAVVVPRIAAMPDLVLHGLAGEVFAPGDVADLTSKIALLLTDDAYRCALTARAQPHIATLCDPRRYCEYLESLHLQ